MNEGVWINGSTTEFHRITEHANWIKIHANAIALGVAEEVWQTIKDVPNDYGSDGREEIVLTILSSGPFIRMRGEGTRYTFEFMCATSIAMQGILRLCKAWAGPYTIIQLNNLRTQETIALPYNELIACAEKCGANEMPPGSPGLTLSKFATGLVQHLNAIAPTH